MCVCVQRRNIDCLFVLALPGLAKIEPLNIRNIKGNFCRTSIFALGVQCFVILTPPAEPG